jgi:hypothetical protein
MRPIAEQALPRPAELAPDERAGRCPRVLPLNRAEVPMAKRLKDHERVFALGRVITIVNDKRRRQDPRRGAVRPCPGDQPAARHARRGSLRNRNALARHSRRGPSCDRQGLRRQLAAVRDLEIEVAAQPAWWEALRSDIRTPRVSATAASVAGDYRALGVEVHDVQDLRSRRAHRPVPRAPRCPRRSPAIQTPPRLAGVSGS